MITNLGISSISNEIIGPAMIQRYRKFSRAKLTIEKSSDLHQDVIYLSVTGRVTKATARQRLNIHPLTLAQASDMEQIIDLLSTSILEVIPILEGTLALAGEP